MLPTRASTSRSWTSSPNRLRTSAPIESSGSPRRGSSGSIAARALPGSDSRPAGGQPGDARRHPEQQPLRDGVQPVVPHGRRCGRRRGRRRARRRAASSTASGTLARKASAPSSTAGRPANGVVRSLPPNRSSASRTSMDTAAGSTRSARNHAVARPLIPPPTTRTRVTPRARAAARAAMTVGSSFIDACPPEHQAGCLRTPAGLDVEVVEHLEVIGDEAARAHQQAVGVLRPGQLVDHGEDVGADPRLRRAPGGLPRRPTTRPRRQPDGGGDGDGGGAHLGRVRVAGVEDAHGAASGR